MYGHFGSFCDSKYDDGYGECAFWSMTPCSLLEIYQRFGRAYEKSHPIV
jgi:hypothetical protein